MAMQSCGQDTLKTQLDSTFNRLYPEAEAPGISVRISQGDGLLYTFQQGLANLEGQEKIHEHSRFRMASVSKQVTARSVYWLAEQGKIDLDQPISDWFDGLPESWEQVTPRHLISHTSGVWDYEDLIPDGQTEQLRDEDVLRLSRLHDEVYFPAGQEFRYSNTGYCLLALLVKEVIQEPYADFVQNQLFLPIDIQDGMVYNPQSIMQDRAYGYHPTEDGFLFADQSLTSATQGDGGVYFSIEDYHRWADQRLFSDFAGEDFLRDFHENASMVTDSIRYNMGLFFFHDDKGQLHLFHSGESTGFRNIVYLVPAQKTVISIFTNRDDLGIATAFEEVAKSLSLTLPVSENLFIWLSKVYMDDL